MTLPGGVHDVSASRMTRLIALLMLCVLTLSHGSAGASVPHADHGIHTHSQGHDHGSAIDDRNDHDNDPIDEATDTGRDAPVERDVAHVHPAADMVPQIAPVSSPTFVDLGHARPPSAGPLVSTDPAPLLEPPSA